MHKFKFLNMYRVYQNELKKKTNRKEVWVNCRVKLSSNIYRDSLGHLHNKSIYIILLVHKECSYFFMDIKTYDLERHDHVMCT